MMTGANNIQNQSQKLINSSRLNDKFNHWSLVCAYYALLPGTSPEIVARSSIPSQSFSASSGKKMGEETQGETGFFTARPNRNKHMRWFCRWFCRWFLPGWLFKWKIHQRNGGSDPSLGRSMVDVYPMNLGASVMSGRHSKCDYYK